MKKQRREKTRGNRATRGLRPQNGAEPAGTAPAGQPKAPGRLAINETQKLAAELMAARTQLQRKNVLIGSLYDEINALRKDVLQGGVNAEARENQLTAERYGLPVTFSAMGRDEDGEWFVECEPQAIPKEAAGKVVKLPVPPQEEEEDEEDEEQGDAPDHEPEEPVATSPSPSLEPAGKA